MPSYRPSEGTALPESPGRVTSQRRERCEPRGALVVHRSVSPAWLAFRAGLGILLEQGLAALGSGARPGKYQENIVPLRRLVCAGRPSLRLQALRGVSAEMSGRRATAGSRSTIGPGWRKPRSDPISCAQKFAFASSCRPGSKAQLSGRSFSSPASSFIPTIAPSTLSLSYLVLRHTPCLLSLTDPCSSLHDSHRLTPWPPLPPSACEPLSPHRHGRQLTLPDRFAVLA